MPSSGRFLLQNEVQHKPQHKWCGGRGGDERGARSFDPGCPDGSALDVHVLMDIQSAAFVTVKAKMTRYMVSYPLPCELVANRNA